VLWDPNLFVENLFADFCGSVNSTHGPTKKKLETLKCTNVLSKLTLKLDTLLIMMLIACIVNWELSLVDIGSKQAFASPLKIIWSQFRDCATSSYFPFENILLSTFVASSVNLHASFLVRSCVSLHLMYQIFHATKYQQKQFIFKACYL